MPLCGLSLLLTDKIPPVLSYEDRSCDTDKMPPSVLIDTTSDFAPTPAASAQSTHSTSRTLLLAPPSVSSHPELLDRIFEAHDRKVTDIQMLDRLGLGLVSLPPTTYDLVLLLTDADGTRAESQKLLDRKILSLLVQALKPGGVLKSQDGRFASEPGTEQTEVILAGLNIEDGGGASKPQQTEGTVKLNFGRKSNAAAGTKRAHEEPGAPAGVGFVDFSDDFGDDYDDDYIPSKEELMADGQIDPDTLLTEEDRKKPVVIRKPCPLIA